MSRSIDISACHIPETTRIPIHVNIPGARVTGIQTEQAQPWVEVDELYYPPPPPQPPIEEDDYELYVSHHGQGQGRMHSGNGNGRMFPMRSKYSPQEQFQNSMRGGRTSAIGGGRGVMTTGRSVAVGSKTAARTYY